ncbi:acyl-CoA dehydrogenase family protein [Pseudodonghicola flavimaris]|uniref:Acyl-CoA dehydrogenase family protein n=1 Tax=Pseudodonghicola flavimaris TaxID=3050036 RepID=A0ABT7F1A5_9RHOB|nr:acyl-CoA dehydrogenase family protein [Pseudodonghicola flavimaris]MDK3018254.1 acyl-CoA dehydrogenase family protein [Pseudodonghicola flavimaris]
MAKLVKNEEEIMLADAARGFLDDAAPLTKLRGLRDAGKTHDPALWTEMAQMGWTGVLVPEEAGGSDMGHAAACVLAEEMGKTLAPTPFLSTAVIAATALRQVASDRATAALSKIADGTVTYALAIDEGKKFDPETVELTAEKDGNGFRLSGRKRFVVDGGFADRLLVLARTDGGLTLFDIPADRAGISRNATPMIDSRDAAEIDFDKVEATGEDVLGQVDAAMTVLQPALEAGQAALAAEMTGLAAGAFGMTVGYLKERKQFGMLIGSFQALQHRAADLWCECEVTASAILHAGRMLDSDPQAATLAVSLAKARAADTAQRAVQEGVQMHGGIGMTDEFDMGFYMRRARVGAEWLGDYGYHAGVVARLRGF